MTPKNERIAKLVGTTITKVDLALITGLSSIREKPPVFTSRKDAQSAFAQAVPFSQDEMLVMVGWLK
jgi:hypothetical protein